MDPSAPDIVIWGLTKGGRPFRPSDWAERLAGLTAAFKLSDRLAYSALVLPATVKGVRAVIVSGTLRGQEPRLHQFLLNFARDNELLTTTCENAITAVDKLTPPEAGRRAGEPREPV